MTEDDAKAKWCPFARVAVTVEDNQRRDWIGVTGANRGALHPTMAIPDVEDRLNPPSAHCIASACMAWRVRKVLVPTTYSFAPEPEKTTSAPSTAPMPEYRLDGFCGLAGSPH